MNNGQQAGDDFFKEKWVCKKWRRALEEKWAGKK